MHLCCTAAIGSTWKLVGRFYGMLHLFAKRHRSSVWWEDALWKTFWATTWRTDYSMWFIGWVSPYNCEGSVTSPSIWKEIFTWIVPWIRFVRGWNLEGWPSCCRHWGIGNDGRIGNLLKKDNAKEVIFPEENGKYSRRWTNQTSWRRSGPENIHPWYGNDQFEEKVTLIFLENQKGLFHHLMTHFRMPVKWQMIFGPCQETTYTAITLNQESNSTRREKNHFLFHCSTLTFQELLIRIWMSSKRNAWMIL